MTPEQKVSFHAHGFLHLPRALGKELVQPVRNHVLRELKSQQIWSTGRLLSKRLEGIPAFQQVAKLGQWIRYPALEDSLVPPSLSAAMRALAGTPLTSARDAQLLLSLPDKSAWSLERLNWHRDIGKMQLAGIPGIQAFILIDDLAPRGGATLALAGSHKLSSPAGGMQNLSRLVAETGGMLVVDDTKLSLLEMTGGAGDVYLLDMRVIHTPSINALRNVRMMATVRYIVP